MSKVADAATQHIAFLQLRISHQTALIAKLKGVGADATEALHALRLMELALESMRCAMQQSAAPAIGAAAMAAE